MMICPSSDLRNKYGEISDLCHNSNEPVYLTKNGYGDLVLLSMEAYEALVKNDLYVKISNSLKSMEFGEEEDFEDAMADIRKELGL